MNDLNLDKPIFVLYYNINIIQSEYDIGVLLESIGKSLSYSNITIWILPVYDKETKIECIYDGILKNKDKKLNNLINIIQDRINKISELTSLEQVKQYIRNWRLDDLLNDTNDI
jgi:hypothetical protein